MSLPTLKESFSFQDKPIQYKLLDYILDMLPRVVI